MGMVSRIGSWIDTKWPDKVVVTDGDYRALLKTISDQDLRIQNLCKEVVELVKLTTEVHTDVNKLKVSSAFSNRGALGGLGVFPPITQPNAKQ